MRADQIRNRTVGCKMTDSEYERLSAVVESEGLTGKASKPSLVSKKHGSVIELPQNLPPC